MSIESRIESLGGLRDAKIMSLAWNADERVGLHGRTPEA